VNWVFDRETRVETLAYDPERGAVALGLTSSKVSNSLENRVYFLCSVQTTRSSTEKESYAYNRIRIQKRAEIGDDESLRSIDVKSLA
jgi:hypothetical protein